MIIPIAYNPNVRGLQQYIITLEINIVYFLRFPNISRKNINLLIFVELGLFYGVTFLPSLPNSSRKVRYCLTIFSHCSVFETKFQHLLSERLTSLGIMGEPRVPPLNPSDMIVLSEHYRLWGV